MVILHYLAGKIKVVVMVTFAWGPIKSSTFASLAQKGKKKKIIIFEPKP